MESLITLENPAVISVLVYGVIVGVIFLKKPDTFFDKETSEINRNFKVFLVGLAVFIYYIFAYLSAILT